MERGSPYPHLVFEDFVPPSALALLPRSGRVQGITATPSPEWTASQLRQFVIEQQFFSGGALASTVVHSQPLPRYSNAETHLIVGSCEGLDRSTGVDYGNVAGQQIQHLNWAPVDQGPGINHGIDVTSEIPPRALHHQASLLKFGAHTFVLEPASHNLVQPRVANPGATSANWPSAQGRSFDLTSKSYRFSLVDDPHMDSIEVRWGTYFMIGYQLAGDGPAVVQETSSSSNGPQRWCR